jgi:hypothetical protein
LDAADRRNVGAEEGGQVLLFPVAGSATAGQSRAAVAVRPPLGQGATTLDAPCSSKARSGLEVDDPRRPLLDLIAELITGEILGGPEVTRGDVGCRTGEEGLMSAGG